MARMKRESWRQSAIDACKKQIKTELDEVLQAAGESERLSYILEHIQQLETAVEPADLLRRFIFVMSALVHHERCGGLGKKQINELSQLGQAILRVVGIKTGHAPASYLHAELHAIISDIHYSNGEFLSSLWERQLGTHAAVMPAEHQARQNLGMGICALRLGNTQLAVQLFQGGLRETHDPLIADRLRVHLLKARRLRGDHALTAELVRELEPLIQHPACIQEAAWEKACLGASMTLDFEQLFALSKRGQTHHKGSYLLELFLWANAHPKTHWAQKSYKIATLASKKELDFSRYSHLFSLAQNIEQAYDATIPFAKRLFDIKKVLPKIPLLPQVDQELLVWLALTRWLYRCHSYAMASITCYEYESLSHKLSSGRTRDVLGLAEDLLEVDWAQKTFSEAS